MLPSHRGAWYGQTTPKMFPRLSHFSQKTNAHSAFVVVLTQHIEGRTALRTVSLSISVRMTQANDFPNRGIGHMNHTAYDPKNKIARIEPGANWGLVYRALDPHGVAAVGGRASPVGVGGFITGGGVSMMLF